MAAMFLKEGTDESHHPFSSSVAVLKLKQYSAYSIRGESSASSLDPAVSGMLRSVR